MIDSLDFWTEILRHTSNPITGRRHGGKDPGGMALGSVQAILVAWSGPVVVTTALRYEWTMEHCSYGHGYQL